MSFLFPVLLKTHFFPSLVSTRVTTRPWSVPILTEKCGDQISCQVEILGLTKEDIVRYISCAFNDLEIKRQNCEILPFPPSTRVHHGYPTKCHLCSSDLT